jgi:hypothetical protein
MERDLQTFSIFQASLTVLREKG